jgi:hypothetical protein
VSANVQKIEQAVSNLPSQELALFRRWFQDFDAQTWDAQFEQDVKAGKLDKLAERAIDEYQAGQYKEL